MSELERKTYPPSAPESRRIQPAPADHPQRKIVRITFRICSPSLLANTHRRCADKGTLIPCCRPVLMLRTHVSRRLLSQLSQRAPNRFVSTSVPSHSSPIRTALYTSVFAVSAGLFAVYYFDSRSAIHRYVFTPAIRYALDPEAGHKFALKVLASGLAPRDTQEDDEILKAQVCPILPRMSAIRPYSPACTAVGRTAFKSYRPRRRF